MFATVIVRFFGSSSQNNWNQHIPKPADIKKSLKGASAKGQANFILQNLPAQVYTTWESGVDVAPMYVWVSYDPVLNHLLTVWRVATFTLLYLFRGFYGRLGQQRTGVSGEGKNPRSKVNL